METKNEVKAKADITDLVLAKVNQMTELGELVLPKDYSAENALKSAFLHLQDVQTMDKKPVLEACDKSSISLALLKMVTQGLNVGKTQCYFIPYGSKLEFQRSYQGSVALAKRLGGVMDVKAHIIYEGDEFEFSVDLMTGRKIITKHDQKFENIDDDKIKGAYAVVLLSDGGYDVEIMTKAQIDKSHSMSKAKSSPAHTNFKGEMAKKTVIQRACKGYISRSNDSHLFDEGEEITQAEIIEQHRDSKQEIKTIEITATEVEQAGF